MLQSSALASLSKVSVFTVESGCRQRRLMVLKLTSLFLDKLDILNPRFSASSFNLNLAMTTNLFDG
jgi:hypothetical protein